MIFYIMV